MFSRPRAAPMMNGCRARAEKAPSERHDGYKETIDLSDMIKEPRNVSGEANEWILMLLLCVGGRTCFARQPNNCCWRLKSPASCQPRQPVSASRTVSHPRPRDGIIIIISINFSPGERMGGLSWSAGANPACSKQLLSAITSI